MSWACTTSECTNGCELIDHENPLLHLTTGRGVWRTGGASRMDAVGPGQPSTHPLAHRRRRLLGPRLPGAYTARSPDRAARRKRARGRRVLAAQGEADQVSAQRTGLRRRRLRERALRVSVGQSAGREAGRRKCDAQLPLRYLAHRGGALALRLHLRSSAQRPPATSGRLRRHQFGLGLAPAARISFPAPDRALRPRLRGARLQPRLALPPPRHHHRRPRVHRITRVGTRRRLRGAGGVPHRAP